MGRPALAARLPGRRGRPAPPLAADSAGRSAPAQCSLPPQSLCVDAADRGGLGEDPPPRSRRPEPQPRPQRPRRLSPPRRLRRSRLAHCESGRQATAAAGLRQREARAPAGGGGGGRGTALAPSPPRRAPQQRLTPAPPPGHPLSGAPRGASPSGLSEPLPLPSPPAGPPRGPSPAPAAGPRLRRRLMSFLPNCVRGRPRLSAFLLLGLTSPASLVFPRDVPGNEGRGRMRGAAWGRGHVLPAPTLGPGASDPLAPAPAGVGSGSAPC